MMEGTTNGKNCSICAAQPPHRDSCASRQQALGRLLLGSLVLTVSDSCSQSRAPLLTVNCAAVTLPPPARRRRRPIGGSTAYLPIAIVLLLTDISEWSPISQNEHFDASLVAMARVVIAASKGGYQEGPCRCSRIVLTALVPLLPPMLLARQQGKESPCGEHSLGLLIIQRGAWLHREGQKGDPAENAAPPTHPPPRSLTHPCAAHDRQVAPLAGFGNPRWPCLYFRVLFLFLVSTHDAFCMHAQLWVDGTWGRERSVSHRERGCGRLPAAPLAMAVGTTCCVPSSLLTTVTKSHSGILAVISVCLTALRRRSLYLPDLAPAPTGRQRHLVPGQLPARLKKQKW
jgi:hypothetical protein